MDGDEADPGSGVPEHPGSVRTRRIAPGQVWIACALCRSPVELADTVQTPEGHVCPRCAPGV